MSVALYVCSTSPFSGKTAVCSGIARYLLEDGLSVGYLKPLSVVNSLDEAKQIDEDAELMSDFSGQQPIVDLVTPVRLTSQDIEATLLVDSSVPEYSRRLRNAHQQFRDAYDVVLLEGGANLAEGAIINLQPASLVQDLQIDALVVIKYATDLQMVDEILMTRDVLGNVLLGVVLNSVPIQRVRFIEDVVVPAVRRRNVRVLAVLPQRGILQAISVEEMVRALGGEILCAAENRGELVENLMVGAMNVDVALSYFRGTPDKAVFTGGDRLDIQLAALETSTRCLVLTGNLPPSPLILNRAAEVGVPLIVVNKDTLTAVRLVERQFGNTPFHYERKIREFDILMEENFDFEALYSNLGLA